MKKFLLIALLAPLVSFAQKIENLKAVVNGDEIIITYDISSQSAVDKFEVSIYSSHNNYSVQLQQLSGDVGSNLGVGAGKRVIWYARNELGSYKGEISFEVRAEVIAGLLQTNQFASARRGKSIPITWTGGNKGQDVKIEFVKAGSIEGVIATVPNNGSYQWNILSKQKPAKDYQIRLVNGKETSNSAPFAVKHKIPTLVKVLPVVAIAAVVVLVTGKKSEEKASLPAPPDLGL